MKSYSMLLLAIVASLFFATSCSVESGYTTVRGEMLGTTFVVKSDLPAKTILDITMRAAQIDAEMKLEMSLFDANSQLSRINADLSDSLTPNLEYNIRLADSVSRLSGGIYDITVAPLVKAWGFAAKSDMVESPNIDSLLEFVGYEGLSIVDGRLRKADRRMQIDLNSIAKGYTVDCLAEAVEQMGAQNYMIDIGGELRLKGVNPNGEAWRIGIETPFDGNMSDGEFLEQRLAIAEDLPLRAVATSGNYRRFHLTEDGRKVVHTINPLTGASAPSSLLSVTVLAPNCALADAYATMLLAAGDEHAEQLAEQIENCEVYFIYNRGAADNDDPTDDEYEVYFSSGMRKLLLD